MGEGKNTSLGWYYGVVDFEFDVIARVVPGLVAVGLVLTDLRRSHPQTMGMLWGQVIYAQSWLPAALVLIGAILLAYLAGQFVEGMVSWRMTQQWGELWFSQPGKSYSEAQKEFAAAHTQTPEYAVARKAHIESTCFANLALLLIAYAAFHLPSLVRSLLTLAGVWHWLLSSALALAIAFLVICLLVVGCYRERRKVWTICTMLNYALRKPDPCPSGPRGKLRALVGVIRRSCAHCWWQLLVVMALGFLAGSAVALSEEGERKDAAPSWEGLGAVVVSPAPGSQNPDHGGEVVERTALETAPGSTWQDVGGGKPPLDQVAASPHGEEVRSGPMADTKTASDGTGLWSRARWWLERNKVFFETPLGAVLAVIGVWLLCRQTRIMKRQTKLMEKQTELESINRRPYFIASPKGPPEDREATLEISNGGFPIRYVQRECTTCLEFQVEGGTEFVRRPVKRYRDEEDIGLGTGSLFAIKGDPWHGEPDGILRRYRDLVQEGLPQAKGALEVKTFIRIGFRSVEDDAADPRFERYSYVPGFGLSPVSDAEFQREFNLGGSAKRVEDFSDEELRGIVREVLEKKRL